MNSPALKRIILAATLLIPALVLAGSNTLALPPAPLPGAAGSVMRMLASLAFVIALFFGGVWLFKNWQRVSRIKNKTRLHIVEAQPLGPRQAIYVIGYQDQRFLIGASPAGVSLISALPEADAMESIPATQGAPPTFATLLQGALGKALGKR